MEKFVAHDIEDLSIISTHLQDALLRYEDIKYLPKRRIFAFMAKRYVWSAAEPIRRNTACHIEGVLKVQQLGIATPHPDLVLSLLALNFEAGDAPAGHIHLCFSAGFSIRLETECLSVHMTDLPGEWPASRTPQHQF